MAMRAARKQKTKMRSLGLMIGTVNPVWSLLCLQSFQGFPFLNMTSKSLHYLALPISPLVALSPWLSKSCHPGQLLHGFRIFYSFHVSPSTVRLHPLLLLKIYFPREALPDQSEHSITTVSRHTLYLSLMRPITIMCLFV